MMEEERIQQDTAVLIIGQPCYVISGYLAPQGIVVVRIGPSVYFRIDEGFPNPVEKSRGIRSIKQRTAAVKICPPFRTYIL